MKQNTVNATMENGNRDNFICDDDFIFLRGYSNRNKVMGTATRKGKKYKIRVASCGLPYCYCAAKAIEIKIIKPMKKIKKVSKKSKEEKNEIWHILN